MLRLWVTHHHRVTPNTETCTTGTCHDFVATCLDNERESRLLCPPRARRPVVRLAVPLCPVVRLAVLLRPVVRLAVQSTLCGPELDAAERRSTPRVSHADRETVQVKLYSRGSGRNFFRLLVRDAARRSTS